MRGQIKYSSAMAVFLVGMHGEWTVDHYHPHFHSHAIPYQTLPCPAMAIRSHATPFQTAPQTHWHDAPVQMCIYSLFSHTHTDTISLTFLCVHSVLRKYPITRVYLHSPYRHLLLNQHKHSLHTPTDTHLPVYSI